MNVLRIIFNFYIHSSIHVALAIVSLTLLSEAYLNISTDLYLKSFIFTASISGYNFVKYAGIAKWHHQSLKKSLKSIQVFSFLVFLVMLYLFWNLPFKVQVIAFISGFLTLLYAVPLQRKWKNLRSIPGMKLTLIAVVLIMTTVLMPVAFSGNAVDFAVILLCLLRLVWITVLILPFEIRDLKVDSTSLGTIPQILGVFKTKIFGTILLVLLAFAEIYFNTLYTSSLEAVLIVILLTGLALWFSSEKRSFYYTAFWVEAIPIAWLILELAF